MDKCNLLWVQTHPTQYVSPLLDKISESKNINLKAIYISDFSTKKYYDKQFLKSINWDVNLLSNHKFEFLNKNSKTIRFYLPLILPSFKLLLLLKESDYIVIQGWQHYMLIIIGIIGKILGKKVLQRSETPAFMKLDKNRLVFKKSFLHKLVSFVSISISDYFLFIGTLNKNYYLSRGIKSNKLFLSPYAVNDLLFKENLEKSFYKNNFKINFKNKNPTLLYASKLTERKNILSLLDQYKDKFVDNLNFIIVGNGPLSQKVIEFIKHNNLSENVKFLGFVNQNQLPYIYSISDIFILPSYGENWGVVINEAMCGSCAIIASNEVGAAYDLIKHKSNGFIYKSSNKKGIAKAINFCIEEKRYISMGKKSKEIIKNWNYDATINTLNKIIFQSKR